MCIAQAWGAGLRGDEDWVDGLDEGGGGGGEGGGRPNVGLVVEGCDGGFGCGSTALGGGGWGGVWVACTEMQRG